MADTTITPTSPLPEPPNTRTDTKPVFLKKADAFNMALDAWVDEFNDNIPALNAIGTAATAVGPYLSQIDIVSQATDNIGIVAPEIADITAVATNIVAVNTAADNMAAIIAAPAAAQRAEAAAEKAEQIADLTPSTTPVASGTPVADEAGKIAAGWLPPVTPAAHHSSHEPGGSDAITTFSGTASGKFSGTVVEKSQALGTISGTKTIDLSAGLSISATIGGATTLAFSNVPTGGAVVVVLRLTNGGSAAVTWPAAISWADSAAPTLTEAGTDMVVLMTDNGGANWWGNAALEFGTGA